MGPFVKELNDLPPERRHERMYVLLRTVSSELTLACRIALYENLRLFTMRLASCLPSASHPTPISSTSNIIDLDGVSLSLIWSVRSHLQASASLASTIYPEFIVRCGTLSGDCSRISRPSYGSSMRLSSFPEHGTLSRCHLSSRTP